MSKTLDFKVFCFEYYAAAHRLTGRETMELFKKYGVLDYLTNFYDVLHTTDQRYIVQDIDKFIEARKV